MALLAVSACSGNAGNALVPGSSGGGQYTTSSVGLGQVGFFQLPANVRQVCSQNTAPGFAHCDSLVRTDIVSPNTPFGYGPSQLQAAYNLPSSTSGAGQTVAIVDAFDDPNAEADLAVYRSTFGLPACTTSNGCFMKVNQEGQQSNYPSPDGGWALEMSLDVDMVSAGCPKCNIMLVEANDNSFANLGKSVGEATKLGARVVSNSYGGSGGQPDAFNYPHNIILASSGDGGYGPQEPAGFPSVVAVGGTSLRVGGTGRGWTETVWGGSGSGCTNYTKPVWQHDSGCAFRTMNDVAAVADPGTGVAVYDTFEERGFIVVGGTSVSSPLVGSIYGLAGNAKSRDHARSLYYHHKADLYDVTSGADGSCNPTYLCTGEVGYDGPTGWGTPNGIGAF